MIKKLILGIVFFMVMAGTSYGAELFVLGEGTLTLSATSQALPSIPAGTRKAILSLGPSGATAYWKGYGNAPTATAGAPIEALDRPLELGYADLVNKFRIILAGGTSAAVLYIVYIGLE